MTARNEDWSAGTEERRFTDWLRERAEPAWTEAVEHRFVRELGDGSLDDAVFRRYLVQDAAFVGTLASLVGHAAGRAPELAAAGRLADFLATLTGDEDDYFERAFDALDVPAADRASPPRGPVTEAFEDLLVRAALEGDYEEALAVLLPAEWVYLTWATAVADGDRDRWYLESWVALHVGPAFASFVGWLRHQLDELGPALSPRRRRRVDRHFRRTVELEVAFFDQAYDG